MGMIGSGNAVRAFKRYFYDKQRPGGIRASVEALRRSLTVG